jgi:hypothetical protein
MRIFPAMKIPLHEALKQVRDLQAAILEKQRFKGYSGRARALAGCVALAASFLLQSPLVPPTPVAHLMAWTAVFVLGLSLNYGALSYWFLHDPDVARDVRRLRPTLEIIPVLVAGGILTLALIDHGEYDLLFGTWMVMFGLANFTGRQVMPRGMAWIGLYYVAGGAVLLLAWPNLSFTGSPLVMGGVFFLGEFFGGLVLHNDERPMPSLRTFFGLPGGAAPAESEDLKI